MMVSIDICVCTYRRSSLTETLQSIAQQSGMQATLRVIVADNDDIPSAKLLVERISIGYPLPITYCHAPAKNISVARNACLALSTATWIAFIDDDLITSPDWISNLEKKQIKAGSDAVFGPVEAVYPPGTAEWFYQVRPHSLKPAFNDGILKTGYSCNVLIRGNLARAQTFDLRYGMTGGEDTDYFYRLWKMGLVFAFADDAVVFEPINKTRLSMKWLFSRSFRSGQSYARLVTDQRSATYAIISSLIKATYCFTLATFSILYPNKSRILSIRGALHLGALLGLLGLPDIKIYR